MKDPIKYNLSFEETLAKINNGLQRWFAGPKKSPPEINQFPEPIYFKSVDGVIVHSNDAFQAFFSKGITATGRIATSFLHNSIISVSHHTDALILAGVSKIEFEHICFGPEKRWYLMRSYKQRLIQHKDGAYDILGVSRPVAYDDASEITHSLEYQYDLYSSFSPTDQRICLLLAEGRTISEIGQLLDVSAKTVDNHRKKIMASLDFDMAIEIVKMIVRFEERGFLSN